MQGSRTPAEERKRLAELRRLQLGESVSSPSLDEITRRAGTMFHVPIALISIVDRDRVWLQSHFGIDISQIKREGSLCELAIQADDVLVIPDTRKHPIASSHPFVTGHPGVRFYAAAPLRSRLGYNIGTLCILDVHPRTMSDRDKDILKLLAQSAITEMEMNLADSEPHSNRIDPGFDLDLFTGGPTVIFKWQAAEEWPVEYVSSNVSQFGYRAEDFLSGRVRYAGIVHPDDIERVAAEVATYSAQGAKSFTQEYRILRKDGQSCWIYDYTTVVRDATGRVVHYYGYVLDITARKQAEEALRESWAKYEAAIESFDGLVYICSSDLKIEFMNRRLIERTGRDAIGEDCFKALHDRDSACPWCVNEDVLKGKTVRWELQSPKDKRWYYIVNTPLRHSDGTISKMAMIQDITERKQAEEIIRRRESILEAVAFASRQFMRNEGWQQVIRDVLARLGEATGASRVYLFENHTDPDKSLRTSMRHEWTAPGVSARIYTPSVQNLNYEKAGFARWAEELSAGRVLDGHVREFPEAERKGLSGHGIRSVIAVPVFADKQWWGFIGFDSCGSERKWMPVEIDALRTAAGLLGSAVHRSHYEEALRNSEARTRIVLNAIPDLMFRMRKDGTFIDYKADSASDLAVPPDQIIGRNVKDILPPELAAVTLDYIAKTLKTGKRQVYEYDLTTKNGSGRYESRMVVSGPDEVLTIIRDVTERNLAQARLNTLSSAVDYTADSVMITGADGVIQYVNPAFEKLTGYSAEEAIGKTPRILKSGHHPLSHYKALWARLEAGEVVRMEFMNQRKDGSTYYQGETITPIKDEVGRILHFVSTGRDVTARITEREALKESADRLKAIISFLPDATFAIDRDGKIIAWNRAIEGLTGIPASEIIGKGEYEYSVPFYGMRRPILVDLILKPNEEMEREYKYIERSGDTLIAEVFLPAIRQKGIYVWVTATPLYDTEGNIVGAIECIRDITERKQAEEAIRKLAAFPQFNPNAVLEFAADGSLTYYNRAAREMTLSLGKDDPREILPPHVTDIVRDALGTGHTRARVEVPVGKSTLSWSFFPIMDSQTVHAYGVDITERLNLETQMRHLQKMEAVGRLAGGIAHDFNNILTAVLGYSSMLLVDNSLSEDAANQVREIARAADRASQLTRHLLAFGRKQVIQPRVISLNDVLRGLNDMLNRLIREDIRLQIDCSDTIPTIYADQTMLEQVVINMVINARDAMPHGGRIGITTSVEELSLTHVKDNPEARAGRFVKLKIADSGCGMTEDIKAQIFEPFFTTKEAGHGSGLGLATAYGIIKQHNGWIEVDSEPNKGATFSIYLPIHSGVGRPRTEKVHRSDIRGGTETILVVEDEKSVRALAAGILSQYGYRVLEASSGTEGLEVWKKHHGAVDVLLADVIMPGGLTGSELADRLLKENPEMKVILTSGYNLESAGDRFKSVGPYRFLPKPFSPSDLTKAVRDLLDGGA